MIIAHFFVRKVKGKLRLFVETTSSNGLEQPSPAAQDLMPVKNTKRRQEWIKEAYYEFTKRFPNLVLLDTMDNYMRLESDHPSFDLVFRPKAKRKTSRKDEDPPEDGSNSGEDLVSCST